MEIVVDGSLCRNQHFLVWNYCRNRVITWAGVSWSVESNCHCCSLLLLIAPAAIFRKKAALFTETVQPYSEIIGQFAMKVITVCSLTGPPSNIRQYNNNNLPK